MRQPVLMATVNVALASMIIWNWFGFKFAMLYFAGIFTLLSIAWALSAAWKATR